MDQGRRVEKGARALEAGGLLARALDVWDRAGVAYCLLRDGERLERLAGGGELDVLMRAEDLARTGALLRPLGFAELPAPGHGPHRFFVAYDRARDAWLRLDVVDRLDFGRPVPALRTSLEESCLAHRRARSPGFVPAPEEEWVALLLHCVLDKRRFDLPRRARLDALAEHITDRERADRLLAELWAPDASFEALAARVRAGSFDALLDEGPRVERMLLGRDPIGTRLRRTRGRLARRWARIRRLVRPQTLTLALLAPDGAGKSTLAEALPQHFFAPMRAIYMGSYGRASRPLLLPGLAGRVLEHWRRWLEARWRLGRGEFVVFDRHPLEARLDPPREAGALRRARRWLLGHSCPAPDLAIVLDAPGELLHARKGEHSAAALERQRLGYLRLARRLRGSAVVDATRDADAVRREVGELVWRRYVARLARGRRR